MVTNGAEPGEQTFAAKDATAPIGFAITGDLLEDRAALIAELHDEVTEDQSPLMRVTEAFHFHSNRLPATRVQARPRAAGHPFQIECSAEARGLEGLARDFQRVGARVNDPQRLQQAQKALAQPRDWMPIRELLGSARQPPVDLLRVAAADEIVHVAQSGGRGGVHDEENAVQTRKRARERERE